MKCYNREIDEIEKMIDKFKFKFTRHQYWTKKINELKITSQRYKKIEISWVKSMKCEDVEYAIF